MEPSSASSSEGQDAAEDPDWSGEEQFKSCTVDAPVDAADFDVATGFDGDALVHSTSSSDTPLERLGLELNSVRSDMFPEFLQPNTCLDRLGISEAMRRMQAMKEREVEFVRWRSSTTKADDPRIRAGMMAMQRALRRFVASPNSDVTELGQLEECTISGNTPPAAFLKDMHSRALKVSLLNKEEHHGLRAQYQHLITALPQTAVIKIGEDNLRMDALI